MCGLFGFSRKKKKTRIVRMPTFGRQKKTENSTLKQLVNLTTLVSPTQNGFHKPTNSHVCADHIAKLKSELTGSTEVSDSSQGTETSRCTHESHKRSINGRSRTGFKIPDVALLPEIQEHLQRVYHEARGRHEKLSRQDFVAFLQNTQCEELSVAPEQDEYTYSEFLEEWICRHNWDAVRPLDPEEMDLSKPISNYLINSSHNTYLEGHQWWSAGSAKFYQKVLERHCRCIEIDVWNGYVSGAGTPSRSRSPLPGHHRHLSSSSISSTLPRVAAETFVALGEKVEGAKQRFTAARLSEPNPIPDRKLETVSKMIPGIHSRHGSLSMLVPSVPARESSNSLDPNDVGAKLERPRARSKSSKHSINKSEPIVMHGYTLTAPVGLRDVCKAIRDAAFTEENDLPIIVSLEVHADLEQQEVMVDIMKEEWAGLLLEKPFDSCNPTERQPSLHELKRKILIKVKRPPNKATLPPGNNVNLMPPSALDEDVADTDEEARLQMRQQHKNNALGLVEQEQQPAVKVPICESLSALAVYTHSEPFRGKFKVPAAQTHSHIFSVAEKRILELHASDKKAEMLAHNRCYFMRAYPDVIRIGSTNMDPSSFWRKGVQMVAMNWQNWDEDMCLNDAMFRPDTRGWVLKPPGYRSDDNELAIPYRTLDLRITVYAGQNIPLPKKLQNGSDVPSALVPGTTAAEKRFRPSVEVKLCVEKGEEKEKAVVVKEVKFLTPKQFPTPKLVQEERFSSPQLVQQEERFSTTPKLASESRFSSPKLGGDDGKFAKAGSPAPKEVHCKQKTTVKETTHPDWGPDGFDLEFIDVPRVVEQLSFVRFKIEDNSGYFQTDTASWACVRLDRLLQGYRFIDLVDCKGNPSEGRLFVKIDKVVR